MKMYVSILHVFEWIVGAIGALAILGAWIAGENGTVLGLSQEHLYNDATVLLLLSIAGSIGVLIHRQKE